MDKEDILKRSREENSKGDELVIQQKENAMNNSYLVTNACISILALSCYMGITTGNIAIFNMQFRLVDILFAILFLSFLTENGTKYAYFKHKRHLFLAIFWLCLLITDIVLMLKGGLS